MFATSAALAAAWMMAAPAQAGGVRVEPLASFDGKAWGGLMLNSLTDPDLKKQFKAGKGSIRAEGMSLPTLGQAGVRVDALMDARGAKAVMRAIRVEYLVNAPSLEDLASELQAEPEVRYQPRRWEDWSLVAFPTRGLVGVIEREGAKPRVWFLFSPERAELALSRFDLDETDIVERPDPGANWDRVTAFGDVLTEVVVDRSDHTPVDLDSRGRDRLVDRIEDYLRSIRRGPLVFYRGSSGDYRLNVRFTRFDQEGQSKVTVSGEAAVPTPYGPIKVSDSRSKSLKGSYHSRTLDLVEEVSFEIERQVAARVSKLGPPPYSARRDAALAQLMDDITGTKRS